MTARQKKAALLRYRDAEREIDCLLREREKWQARAMRMTVHLSRTPGDAAGRAMEHAAVRVADIETEIDRAVGRAQEERARVLAAIEALPDDRQRDVLRYRYLSGLLFDDIADRMHYSVRQVFSLHGYGLEALELPESTSVQ